MKQLIAITFDGPDEAGEAVRTVRGLESRGRVHITNGSDSRLDCGVGVIGALGLLVAIAGHLAGVATARMGWARAVARIERTIVHRPEMGRAIGPAMPACFRVFASLVVAGALLLGGAGASLAQGDEDEGGPPPVPRPSAGPQTVPGRPSGNPEADRKAYMTLLFQEINTRRDRAASPRYDYMTDAGSEAVDAYLHDLLPAMVSANSCFHGSQRPGMRAGWDYLGDVGIETSKVGGEVLACPDVQEAGFWTPPGIADGWWKSPSHFKTLYGDARPRVLACGAEDPVKGGLAYETVACITLMEEP